MNDQQREPEEARWLGLTSAETNNLKQLLRYGGAIFVAVGLTLVVVALASSLFSG